MKNYKYRETCKLTLKGIKHLPIVDVYRKWVMVFPSYTMLVKKTEGSKFAMLEPVLDVASPKNNNEENKVRLMVQNTGKPTS